ncbi:MAG: EAL domain-containing protein [Beijerinckiaceae bacterium]|nr:EAL domain-containing protein [Beijerinckiaceae bacterium]
MANGEPRIQGQAREADVRRAVQLGQVTPYFQPIESLSTGKCRGFEALARVKRGDGTLMPPDVFLPLLGPDDRLALFGVMLGESIALSRSLGLAKDGLFVSINVEISLVASEHFIDVLRYFLERYDFKGEALVLEILENEDIKDLARLKACLSQVKALGLSIALDDIGSGYASMTRMRELPIDIFKLDRGFVRDLESRPRNVSFIMCMVTLVRGLGKTLLVEGIESAEIYDALRVLGVQVGQGFGIARPMPGADVAPWLASHRPRAHDATPTCLLGAYASHLSVVETCRHLQAQPLPVDWRRDAMTDSVGCAVGRLFTARGWHETAFGAAHRYFHSVLDRYDVDPSVWEEGSTRFRDAMEAVLIASPRSVGCRATPRLKVKTTCTCNDTAAPEPAVRRPRRARVR